MPANEMAIPLIQRIDLSSSNDWASFCEHPFRKSKRRDILQNLIKTAKGSKKRDGDIILYGHSKNISGDYVLSAHKNCWDANCIAKFIHIYGLYSNVIPSRISIMCCKGGKTQKKKNSLPKRVADFLKKNNVNYEYIEASNKLVNPKRPKESGKKIRPQKINRVGAIYIKHKPLKTSFSPNVYAVRPRDIWDWMSKHSRYSGVLTKVDTDRKYCMNRVYF